jgi:hypothetical protein
MSFRAQRGIRFSPESNKKQIPRAKTALGMTSSGVFQHPAETSQFESLIEINSEGRSMLRP